jgi:hypothetical protein
MDPGGPTGRFTVFKRRSMKIGLALAALAVLGMLAPAATAGHCYGGNYSYGYGYNYGYTPSYYSYAPVQYYPVVQKEYVYRDREVQVPYAKPVYLHRDYYYSLKDYYEDKKRDDVVAEAAAYKALLLGVQLQNAAGQRQGYGYGVQSGAALLPPGGYGATGESAPGYGSPPRRAATPRRPGGTPSPLSPRRRRKATPPRPRRRSRRPRPRAPALTARHRPRTSPKSPRKTPGTSPSPGGPDGR